ncbi:MAG: DUF192 domain-containing protein [Rhodospirillaceae bacterium]|jgi:uncharacterized protein|nr:DUF192 domain-containing protein [Rhodospirillales bacterium]MBT3905062.1 DUF192 domain-containing protein [Rhodospirillaceae bacterium]MBT4703086.1 DUF192 domain-containing protein [Rhodospirillaceae bacterium]MBT5034211.1 DUF192 domain-containing protein [Rhodospirillaceae bacterium]MBT6220626.1 DUF192 domain-containing protein [Rhodospirillaceae bacterium]
MVLRRFILLALLCGVIGLVPDLSQAQVKFETSRVSIVTAGGTYNVSVEMATTPEQRSLGLMGRKDMPLAAGMLFDFERTEPITMWMKNTFISLDMLFLDRAGIIVHIARNTQPQSLRHISPGRPVRGVLEVNAGTAARLRIKVGDRVLHGMFGG